MGSLKTILLTGATGYLGSNLAKVFLQRGHTLIVLKRQSSDTTRLQNVIGRIHCYNIEDSGIVNAFKENTIDCVIHTAASYGRKNESIFDVIASNLRFSLTLLEESIKQNIKCFINTDTALPPSVSPYSLSKKQFSSWFKWISQIKIINIELQYFYGPGDDNNKFISFIIGKLLKKAESIDFSEGTQQRDFIYIKDVVSAYELLISNIKDLPSYTNIELGSGVTHSLREITDRLVSISDHKDIKLNFGAIPMRTNEVMHSKADISSLFKLGWSPQYDIDKGFKETYLKEKG